MHQSLAQSLLRLVIASCSALLLVLAGTGVSYGQGLTNEQSESFQRWFKRWEAYQAIYVREQYALESEVVEGAEGPYSQTIYWRGSQGDRVAWLYQRKNMVPRLNDIVAEFNLVLQEQAWDGETTRELTVVTPFEARADLLGQLSGIQCSLFNSQVQRKAGVEKPLWLTPRTRFSVLDCRSISDYLEKTQLSFEGIEDLQGTQAETYTAIFDQSPTDAEISQLEHRWWLDPSRGGAPLQWQISYLNNGQPLRYTASVLAWDDAESGEAPFPKEYQLIEEQGLPDGQWVMGWRREYIVLQCDRNYDDSADFFSTEVPPGVPYEVRTVDGTLEKIEIVDQKGMSIVIFDAASDGADNDRQKLREFLLQHAANPNFAHAYEPPGYMTQWPRPRAKALNAR